MKKFTPIIQVIEEEYEIPHLDATRRISALLPHDYHDTDKKYPIPMHPLAIGPLISLCKNLHLRGCKTL
jgi:hypothetical protein